MWYYTRYMHPHLLHGLDMLLLTVNVGFLLCELGSCFHLYYRCLLFVFVLNSLHLFVIFCMCTFSQFSLLPLDCGFLLSMEFLSLLYCISPYLATLLCLFLYINCH